MGKGDYKKEDNRSLSGHDVRDKLYGEFKSSDDVSADKDPGNERNVFDPHDKLFTDYSKKKEHEEQLELPIEDQAEMPIVLRAGAFMARSRKHMIVLLGIAPVLLLAFVAIFLLFYQSSVRVSKPGETESGSQKHIRDDGANIPLGGSSIFGRGDGGARDASALGKSTGMFFGHGRGRYTIQVFISNQKRHAEKLAADLRGQGYDANVEQTVSAKGSEMYKVYVGRFVSFEDAKKKLTEMKKKFGDSFIRKIQNAR